MKLAANVRQYKLSKASNLMHRSHPQIRENEKKDKGNLLLIEKEL